MIIQSSPPFDNRNKPENLKLLNLAKMLDMNPPKFWNKSFPERINDLKKEKKEAEPEKKNSYALVLYREVLTKTIDVIAENNLYLKNNPDNAEIKELNDELNKYYKKYFDKYCKTPNKKTCHDLLKNEFGAFFTKRSLTKEDFTQKKSLADAGYSMSHEIKKWLDTEVSSNDLTQFITNEVTEFITWAETHPREASFLAADIALTCSILLNKDASDNIITSLNAMIYSKIFLDGLGLLTEKKIESDKSKLLKFRALADFISYSPLFAKAFNITKNTIGGKYSSFFNFCIGASSDAIAINAAQKIIRIMPEGQEKTINLVLGIIQGHDLQSIIAEQRNLALVQLTGAVLGAIKNQDSFLNVIEISFKTLLKSTGSEKKHRIFAQLFLPAISIVIFASGIFLTCAGHIAIGMAAFSLTIIAPALLLNLAIYLTMLINSGIGKGLMDEVKFKIKQKNKRHELLHLQHSLLNDPDKKQRIRIQVLTFIKDLQNKLALPTLPGEYLDQRLGLDADSKELIIELKRNYLEKLDHELLMRNAAPTPANIVTLFNDVVNLKKLRDKLKRNQVDDRIAFFVTHDLINEWLKPQLEDAFIEVALELRRNEVTEENAHATETVQQYLDRALPQKDPIMSDPLQNSLVKNNLLKV